ncbi:MAG: hypothetical protein WB762_25290 [Candidatus Sulfotelmatobacter sp.]
MARDLEHLTPEASAALTGELAKRGVDGTEGMNVSSDEKEQENPSSFFFLHHHCIGERAMDVLHFLGHLALSTLGVVAVAAPVLIYSVVLSLHPFFPSLGTRTVHWILTETPFFPVQIVVGLLLGFQLGRRYRHRVMLWTWVVPALAIALLILFAPFSPVVVSGVELTKAERFFGRGCLPQNHCLDWAFTVLLYAASAYSLVL